ncbi:hydrogenase maturation protease [Maribacter algarum]|uniref:Hydrogenase maturation protease n=1 Tax=Maribacter algarum (ex Zhang et al. 2020) TaxID=2578118 RepID=A0A5S3PUT9_9FLAO|nr:hydrogenase maturation protease [Maribacter algarum]TMM56708.1 hydrogenase maturation protease [Maribacter algarum]
MQKKILIAGVGNELKQDDAFGIEFAKIFRPKVAHLDNIMVMEVGIGGIHLVQELHASYDILVLVDAVAWGEEAGHIYFREMEKVSDIEEMPVFEKRVFLADMHYTNPIRALMLAKALKVLPAEVYILGCEAAEHDDFAIGMTTVVTEAIPKAIDKLLSWLSIKI